MGNYSGVGRVTWAASSKDKIRLVRREAVQRRVLTTASTRTRSTTPEASTDAWGRGWIPQVRWTRAQSNKLLLEAGLAYYTQPLRAELLATIAPADGVAAPRTARPAC